MAYIDFKRNGQTFKCILGTAIVVPKNFTDYSGRIVANASTTRIQSTGVELLNLFNIRKVDWDNPPDDTSERKKGYVFESESGFKLEFYKSNLNINPININIIGKVDAGGSVIEPQYTYKAYDLNIKLSINGVYTFLANVKTSYENCNTQLPSGPSNAPSFNQSWFGKAFLSICKLNYEDNEIFAYTIQDMTTYKPYTFVFGNRGSATGYGVRGYIGGTSLKNVGAPLMKRIDNMGYYYYNGKEWVNKAYTDYLYGNGNSVFINSDIPIFFYFGSWAFLKNNPLPPDDTTMPQYPDQPQNPDEPTDEPTGGDGDGDKSSDTILDSDSVTPYKPTGLLSIYKLNETQLNSLGVDLWSENFFNSILKITQNAIDAVISLRCMYFNFEGIETANIKLGNYTSDIITTRIENYIGEINFGTLNVSRFFGDFKDYNPWTKISIYLPFIGIKDLSVNEIMNGTIKLIYKIDVLSGKCLALITVTNTVDGTNLNSVLYQFDCDFAIEIPISQASANTMVAARLSQLQSLSNMITRVGNNVSNNGNNWQKANIISNELIDIGKQQINANHLDITRVGNTQGSLGMLAIKTPYLIIERILPNYPSSYAHNIGVPTDRTIPLKTLKGFTQISEIFISNFTGTQNEYEELLNILRQGVVF